MRSAIDDPLHDVRRLSVRHVGTYGPVLLGPRVSEPETCPEDNLLGLHRGKKSKLGLHKVALPNECTERPRNELPLSDFSPF